jgi:hypothetical protein
MISIQIDERKYKKIIKGTYDNVGYTLFDDYKAFDIGFEKLRDLIDSAMLKTKK